MMLFICICGFDSCFFVDQEIGDGLHGLRRNSEGSSGGIIVIVIIGARGCRDHQGRFENLLTASDVRRRIEHAERPESTNDQAFQAIELMLDERS